MFSRQVICIILSTFLMQHPAQIMGELLDLEDRKIHLQGMMDNGKCATEVDSLHTQQAQLAVNLASSILHDGGTATPAAQQVLHAHLAQLSSYPCLTVFEYVLQGFSGRLGVSPICICRPNIAILTRLFHAASDRRSPADP